MRTNELMLYKNMEHGEILQDMTFLMENCENEYYNREDLRSLLYECMNEILELSVSHGFEGNLWHTYLTFLLVNDENAYSTSCEIVGEIDGSINEIALHDFQIFKELFDYDFQKMERQLSAECMQILFDYKNTSNAGKVFNRRVRDRICTLSQGLGSSGDAVDFKRKMTQFYKEFGVGKLGLHKAFRIDHPEGQEMSVEPITNIAHVHLDDLVGYEIAKKKLTDNTEAFVKGKKANNCLLFGDAGTGKSSSIKAILNQYYDQGLRMIEVYKHQFQDLNDVIAQIKNRNYKFIIYMDDLSFEEFEIEYKYLKAVIEGGLERTYIALDYFDASINRISAWVTGFRSFQKALLNALCTPSALLKELQDTNQMSKKMVVMEECKTLPIGDIWEEYCRRCNVPAEGWFEEIEKYETEVLVKRA